MTYVVADAIGSTTVRFDDTTVLDRRHFDPWGKRIHADGASWSGSWSETKIGFTGAEQDDFGLINMGGRMYDPAQRRFVSPDPLVVSPYFEQAWNRYSYAYNNPTTLTDPTGYYVSPAWLCGNDPFFFQFSSVSHAPGSGGPPPGLWTRTSPDVSRTSYQSSASHTDGPQFSGAGYANGQPVARWLIDNGVDAWLQENGDTAIKVSLGISYAALTAATWGVAAEAGVFVGAGEKLMALGATSWRTIVGVSGVTGEGVRRYGNQITRWGAQVMRTARGAPSAAEGAPNMVAGSIRNVNVLRGGQNCVACVIATDATLGGRPASAIGGGPYSAADILAHYPGRSFIPANGYSGILTMMGNWGPGSRGIVWGTRVNDQGHVFDVVNQGGVIRFLDGQTGGAAVLEAYKSLYLLRTY